MPSQQNKNLKSRIKTFFRGDVATDEKTLEKFSRDASLFYVRPEIVVFPKNTEDIRRLVTFVAESKRNGENISLTARSAGSDMSGGDLSTSIVVSMTKYLNHLKKIGKNFAVTEPGVYYRDFEKETLKRGLLLPTFPASREICTVGGMVANNSGGEKTPAYGKTENFVRQIKMVIRDGTECVFEPLSMQKLEKKKNLNNAEGDIYRRMFSLIDENYEAIKSAKPNVSKNSAGYYLWNVYDRDKGVFDLTRLITGSQGTLGVITEATLGLVKPKPYSRLLVIFLKEIKDVAKIANIVLRFKPECFESYDDNTFKVAMKFLPDLAKQMKTGLLKIAWQFLPEFFMGITGGAPKLVLIAQFAGDTPQECDGAARTAQKSLDEFHIKTKVTKSEEEAEKYWTVRRESFNLLRKHMRGLRTAPFIDDFVVLPKYLPKFLPRLYKILDATHLLFTVAGHVGDGNFHIIPLMDLTDPKTPRIIKDISEKVYNLVLDFHGSITGEHNDGLIRSPYLKKMYGKKIYSLFEETKRIFDPDGIFNPGKKTGSSIKYAFDHLDKSA